MAHSVIDRIGFLLRDRETHAGRTTNAVLYFLNGVFVLLYILSTYDFSQLTLSIIRYSELSLGVLFLGEYGIRVYSADNWVAEVTNPYTIIDLLAVLPVFVSPGFDAGFLRGFHTLRVFRFLRLLVDEQQLFGQTLKVRTIRRIELSTTIFLIFFVTTGFIYAFEAPVNPGIENFGDAFYYTVIAVSTVGFGDIIPTTRAGRWVTITAVLVGFILIPWQASRLREASIGTMNCPRCGQSLNESDRFCRKCGLDLTEEFDAESEQPENQSPPVRNE